MPRLKTHDEYIEELATLKPHIECLGEYIRCNIKIPHRCNLCGYEWDIVPTDMLHKTYCPNCTENVHKKTEWYKEELSKHNPNIECLGEYTNNSTRIEHRCKKCGYTWEVSPHGVLSNKGCLQCAGLRRKTTAEYIAELAIKRPTIKCIDKYINSKHLTKHKCMVCGGEWKAAPNNILRKSGCPHCAKNHTHKKGNII